jgi:uncharacterized protein YdcH (DUF465 family)
MIRVPRRSVTRFFIPLLDVMVLLFSIFLLMPIMQKKAAEEAPSNGGPTIAQLRADLEETEREVRQLRKGQRSQEELDRLKKELAQLRDEIERLRKEKGKVLEQRLAVRVLEIDPKNGKLIHYEGWPPRRQVIASKQDAEELIARQRKEVAPQELYYLFVFPRVDSAFPEGRQLQQYFAWFGDVPHGIDRPGLGGK